MTVAKMSGRGLGHTGGTIDKLESIPVSERRSRKKNFFEIVKKHHLVIAGQTKDIAPADKKIYALRDVTATVDDMSLIASSIMSKKLASGADAIVLDVKTGSGSFAGSLENAIQLAEKMVRIGKNMNKKICAVISDMNQQLGYAVGNALEVKEAIDTLNGGGPKDLLELCVTLGTHLMQIAGAEEDETEAERRLRACIADGSAMKKFEEFVAAQGGNPDALKDTTLLPRAAYQSEVRAPNDGYVSTMQCEQIGLAALHTGAGREVKDAPIDFGAGILIRKKIGDRVAKGDVLATVFSNKEELLRGAEERILSSYEIAAEEPNVPPLIYRTVE